MDSEERARKFQISKLLPRHFEILKLKLSGMSNVNIAKTVGCSKQNVAIVSRSPLFIAEYNRRMAQLTDSGINEKIEEHIDRAQTVLKESVVKAAETQADLLESEDDSIRHRASNSIMDRVLGRIEGHNASGPSINVQINTQDAKLLAIAFKESLPNGQANESKSNGQASSASQD